MMDESPAVEKGSNTLRGGKNKYGALTLVGGWTEDRLEPRFAGAKRDARTTAAAQQLEATHDHIDTIGAGLKDASTRFDDRIDYGDVIAYDKGSSAGTWKSVTSSTFRKPADGKRTEFSTSFQVSSHAMTKDPAAMDEYAKRWCNESKTSASERFMTQSTRTTNPTVGKGFKSTTTRRLPGVPKPVEEFRDKIAERGGMNGIRSIARILKIMDDSGDGKLSRVEFKNGLYDYGLDFTETEFFALWNYFDRDNSGFIEFTEFLVGIRGAMNERRSAICLQAFDRLDKTGDGTVTVEDLIGVYDASFHPDVIKGKITEKQALEQFMVQWDRLEKDGIVTKEEFLHYYTDISASVFDDDEWELIIRNAWHIAGGEGVCANTANLRVLATLADGRMEVVCVENDLGLDKSDEAEIIKRLADQGVDAIDISLNL